MNAYRRAGVDVEAANALVERYRSAAAMAARPEAVATVGGFAGLFRWPGRPDAPESGVRRGAHGARDGFLVAGADGVGTKVELARQAAELFPERAEDLFRGLGQDLVAMCANDVLCMGGAPLFFLDYVAAGRLDPERTALLVEGVARACRDVGAALLGGETAEMPGVYAPGAFDLAGFCVGWVDGALGERLRAGPRAGDAAVGVAADGPHSNGFSLIRKVLADASRREGPGAKDSLRELLASDPGGLGEPLADALLRPTRLYVRPVLEALDRMPVRGIAHITGGGLPDNAPRPLAKGLSLEIREGAWPEPPVFAWLARAGGLSRSDLLGTFNLGIGLILYVEPTRADDLVAFLAERGLASWIVGRVAPLPGDEAPRVRFAR